MKKCSLIIILVLIASLGMYLRVGNYVNLHPDNDELYELRNLKKDVSFSRVFRNDENYGDHTSFPGEFLSYYFLLQRDWCSVSFFIEKMEVTGMTLNDFYRLAYVKFIITLMGFLCLIWLWRSYPFGILGMIMYAFHYQLIYHAFSIRPYAVLPELAIFNLLLLWGCFNRGRWWLWFLYCLLFFFTCIYHAYGILIAVLPLVYVCIAKRKFNYGLVLLFLISLCAWCHYASFNSFGIAPNSGQSVVDPFQYMPKKMFFENLFRQLSGGGLVFYALCPVF